MELGRPGRIAAAAARTSAAIHCPVLAPASALAAEPDPDLRLSLGLLLLHLQFSHHKHCRIISNVPPLDRWLHILHAVHAQIFSLQCPEDDVFVRLVVGRDELARRAA